MNIDLYSIIISTAILLLLGNLIALGVSYSTSPDFRERIKNIEYLLYIKLIGLIAIISTLGALTYQFIYATPVCELCWWQRIFMFPIDIIVLVALIGKTRERLVHVMVMVLAGVGWLFAAYHYWAHFKIFVLSQKVSLGCDIYGTLPSCTESPVVIYGFVTIPFMALVAFTAIFVLTLLAHISYKK